MRHYVLTRSAFGRAWDMAANRRRLAVTRAVTLSSLAAQTVEWTWVVLLDESDPLLHDRLAAYGDGVPSFLPIIAPRPRQAPWGGRAGDRQRSAAADYHAAWRAGIPADDTVLLTRLDDDDAFTPDALGRYQEAAVGLTQRTALMLPVGVHLLAGRCTPVRHERNAMHTLVTPPGDSLCVYDYPHVKVRAKMPVVMVDQRPGWLWLRHRDTISYAGYPREYASGPPRKLDAECRSLFPVDWAGLERTWGSRY